MTHTTMLPSCNLQSVELCTFYVAMELTDALLREAAQNISRGAQYVLTTSLGIVLPFQNKYSTLSLR